MKWALIEDGFVANLVIWDWDGSEETDIFGQYTKIKVDGTEIVGGGYLASITSEGVWEFTESL